MAVASEKLTIKLLPLLYVLIKVRHSKNTWNFFLFFMPIYPPSIYKIQMHTTMYNFQWLKCYNEYFGNSIANDVSSPINILCIYIPPHMSCSALGIDASHKYHIFSSRATVQISPTSNLEKLLMTVCHWWRVFLVLIFPCSTRFSCFPFLVECVINLIRPIFCRRVSILCNLNLHFQVSKCEQETGFTYRNANMFLYLVKLFEGKMETG